MTIAYLLYYNLFILKSHYVKVKLIKSTIFPDIIASVVILGFKD